MTEAYQDVETWANEDTIRTIENILEENIDKVRVGRKIIYYSHDFRLTKLNSLSSNIISQYIKRVIVPLNMQFRYSRFLISCLDIFVFLLWLMKS